MQNYRLPWHLLRQPNSSKFYAKSSLQLYMHQQKYSFVLPRIPDSHHLAILLLGVQAKLMEIHNYHNQRYEALCNADKCRCSHNNSFHAERDNQYLKPQYYHNTNKQTLLNVILQYLAIYNPETMPYYSPSFTIPILLNIFPFLRWFWTVRRLVRRCVCGLPECPLALLLRMYQHSVEYSD